MSTFSENQASAVREFFNNRPAMFANLLKIRAKSGKVLPLVLNAMQKDLYPKLTGQDDILKARQLGATTLITGDHFLDAVMLPNLQVVTFVQNEDAIPKFMRPFRFMYEHLPPVVEVDGTKIRLRPDEKPPTRNVTTLELENGSIIDVMTSGGERLGRGGTIHRAHLTEVSVWDLVSAEAIWAAVVGAMPPRGSKVVVESTANGQQGLYFREWNRAVLGDNGFTPHFYPWWWDTDYYYEEHEKVLVDKFRNAPLDDEEKALIEKHNLTMEQINFRRVKHASLSRLFYQEFAEDPTTAFLAAGQSIFEPEQVTLVKRFAREPDTRAGNLRTWQDPEPGARYALLIDSSQGVTEASDFDAMAILKISPPPYVEHVATYMGRVSQHDLAKAAYNLATHYNNALICVEVVDGSGQIVQLYLNEEMKYKRFYMRPKDGEYGWKTGKHNKPGMVDALKQLVDRDLFRTYDERLAAQMSTFVERKLPSGATSVGAASGAYDDLLDAVMMGAAILPEIGRIGTRVVPYGRRALQR